MLSRLAIDCVLPPVARKISAVLGVNAVGRRLRTEIRTTLLPYAPQRGSAAAAHHSSSTPITAVPSVCTPATSRSFTAA